MASPDNRDLGAAVAWVQEPGYREHTHWRARPSNCPEVDMNVISSILAFPPPGGASRKVSEECCIIVLPTVVGDTDVETSPRSPGGQAPNNWAASGKVGTRHLTLGLCLVTTRQAWTKLDSRDLG
jgi:hypothetical protein